MGDSHAPQAFDLYELPPPVRVLSGELAAAGFESYLVGPALRDLIIGSRPPYFDLATSATPAQVVALFPSAVATGIRHGLVTIPTRAGPVDVMSFRAGWQIEDELAHRGFTIDAMAYDPQRQELSDPFGGRDDLSRGVLCAVRSASDRFDEDPVRALRAVRLGATLGLKLDDEVMAALGGAREALKSIAATRVRTEWVAILLAPGVAVAMEQLERGQIAQDFAPNTASGSGALLERLPVDLELRVAGWLRGSNARRVLHRLRFSRTRIERVEQLLRLHPIDAQLNPSRPSSLARFVRRAGARNLRALFALREAEIWMGSPGAPETLEALQRLHSLEAAVRQLRAADARAAHRDALAIRGPDVMKILGCEPGPRVGRALAYLTDRIVAAPALNEPETLGQLLRDWDET